MTVRFEFKFKVREGEGVAGMWDGDSVLWEAERAADEEKAVARFGVPELVVLVACCERDFWGFDVDAKVLIVDVVELYVAA